MSLTGPAPVPAHPVRNSMKIAAMAGKPLDAGFVLLRIVRKIDDVLGGRLLLQPDSVGRNGVFLPLPSDLE